MVKDWNWVEEFLEKEAYRQERLKGYYNNNYIHEYKGKKYLIRVPMHDAEIMDLRAIPEREALKWAELQSFPAPRILYEDPQSNFTIHSFIPGITFSDRYPRETKFPDWVPKNIAIQMHKLHSLKYPEKFKEHCKDYIKPFKSPDDSSYFYSKKIMFIENIYKRMYNDYAPYYQMLGIPKDPFIIPKSKINQITVRPFVFAHCDVHRKNLIIEPPETGEYSLLFIDWELCLICDPFYDIAVHLHKIRYEPHQEQIFLSQYLQIESKSLEYRNALKEIKIYEDLEIIRTVIVDIQRANLDLHLAKNDNEKNVIASHYGVKVNKAIRLFNSNVCLNQQDILRILELIQEDLF